MAFQVKKKTSKPQLHQSNQTENNNKPVIVSSPPPTQSSPQLEQKQQEEKPISTNAMFGMTDIPDSEKNKAMSNEEYNRRLDRGELLFGSIPSIPSFKAIDDITFDYCDGFRIFIPQTEQNQPTRKYRLLIQDEENFTTVCNDFIETVEIKFITTIQKYFAHFGFTVVRVVDLPKELKEKTMKFYGLSSIDVDMIYELCIFPQIKQEDIEKEIFNKCFVISDEDKARYAHAINDLLKFVQDNHTFHHSFDPKDKEVFVQFPVSTIGDSIGWFSYMERFQQKTQCKLICVMNPAIYVLYEKQYPNIKFIPAKDTRNYKPYASYNMGLFFKANTTQQPYDFRYIGNGRTVSKILDVDDTDIPPRVDLSAPRKIKEPYVVIATNGSAYCKMWNHPEGWQKVIDHLKEIGYRIICIDKDRTVGSGVVVHHIPWGVEDDTGNKPLQERIDMLKDCDFFIGVSSGVSWLAWCAKCPVVMISGFTNPFNEYYTPYRVINTFMCHGCWNDETVDFDHYDYMWCPKYKNTPRAYECTRNITPEHVLKVISRIPAYQKMKAKYDSEHTPKVSKYLESKIQISETVEKIEKPSETKPDQISIPAQNFNDTAINIM